MMKRLLCCLFRHRWLSDVVIPPRPDTSNDRPLVAAIKIAFDGPYFRVTCARCGRVETHGDAFMTMALEEHTPVESLLPRALH